MRNRTHTKTSYKADHTVHTYSNNTEGLKLEACRVFKDNLHYRISPCLKPNGKVKLESKNLNVRILLASFSNFVKENIVPFFKKKKVPLAMLLSFRNCGVQPIVRAERAEHP